MNQRRNCFNFLKFTCLILCLTLTLARSTVAQSRITGAVRTSDRIAVQGSQPNRLLANSLGAGIDNLTATYSGDTVLNASQAGPVPVDVADYVVQLIPGAVTVAKGQAGTAVLNLIPVGGFASKIKLACSGQPTTVNCSFSKASVTLDGTNPAPITVTLAARGNLASLAPNRKSNPWGVTTAISLGGLLLLLTRRRSHFRDGLATLCLVGFLFGAIGCSNPAQSTSSAESDPTNNSSKTYTVTITTTSVTGTTPKTATLSLTVSN